MTNSELVADVKASNPILLVYPAGTGGEHITAAISDASPSVRKAESTIQASNNQVFYHSVFDYAPSFIDYDDPTTWINPMYKHNPDAHGRYFIKDHPTDLLLQSYGKHMPDIQVIYSVPQTKTVYFSELAHYKLGKRMVPNELTDEFFHEAVSKNMEVYQKSVIRIWAARQKEFWKHEIDIVFHKLKLGENIKEYETMSLQEHISLNAQYCENMKRHVLAEYPKVFKNFSTINCDTLADPSRVGEYWKQMAQIIPDLQPRIAIRKSEAWARKNNEFLGRTKYGNQE